MPVIIANRSLYRTFEPVEQRSIVTTNFGVNNVVPFPHHDGRFLWVTRLVTQTVTPYDLETETRGSTVNIGTNPVGIWGDKEFFWSISSAGVLRKHDLESATTLETINLPAGTYNGLTGDGRFIWTTSFTTGNVEKYDSVTGSLLDGFTRPTLTSDLHHDGRFLWILTGDSGVQGTIKQYDPVTGTAIHSFNTTNYGLSDAPGGITGDRRFLYITESVL